MVAQASTKYVCGGESGGDGTRADGGGMKYGSGCRARGTNGDTLTVIWEVVDCTTPTPHASRRCPERSRELRPANVIERMRPDSGLDP